MRVGLPNRRGLCSLPSFHFGVDGNTVFKLLSQGAMETFKCSNCGAGLTAHDGAHIACAFCGVAQPVPSAMRERLGLVEEAREHEQEAQAALEHSVLHGAQLPGVLWAALAMVVLLVPGFFFALFAQVYARLITGAGLLHAAVVTVVLVQLAALFAGAVWAVIQSPRWRARATLKQLRAAISAAPTPSQCPACGGPLQVPHLSGGLPCPFCRELLLACEGMVVRAQQSAKERAEGWKAQARAQLERTRAWTSRQDRIANAALPVFLVLSVPLLPSFIPLLFLTRYALRLDVQKQQFTEVGSFVHLRVPRRGGKPTRAVVISKQYSPLWMQNRHVVVTDEGRRVDAGYRLLGSLGLNGDYRTPYVGSIHRRVGAAVLIRGRRLVRKGEDMEWRPKKYGHWTSVFRLGPANSGWARMKFDPYAGGVWVPRGAHAYPGNRVSSSRERSRVVLFNGRALRVPASKLQPLRMQPGLALEVKGPEDRGYRVATLERVVSFALRVRYADGSRGWASAKHMRLPLAEEQ